MSTNRDELARIIDRAEDLWDSADRILAAGYVRIEDQTLRDRQRAQFARDAVAWRERAEAADAKLAKVRELLDDPYADLNLETWSALRKILEGEGMGY